MSLTFRTCLVLALSFLVMLSSAQSDLHISVVMDGPLSGGLPKAVRVCATDDIPDLSIYGIGSANNGLGTDGEEYTFSGSISAGDCLWLSSEALGFEDFFGCPPDIVDGAMNINGDDAIELFMNGLIVDLYGDQNTDGSGQCWEYADGYAYRNILIANAGLFDGSCADGEWTYSGPGALVGINAYKEIVPSQPFGDSQSQCDTTSYYSGIDTTASCDVLKNQLRVLISNMTTIPYGPAFEYDVIDFMCDNDFQGGQLVDRYASTNFTDCYADRYTSGTSAGAVGVGWNREHVFPRSWWGGSQTQPQYVDLHNLFPSDAYVNELKSNYPLGEVQLGATSSSMIGTDISACSAGCFNSVFEPADQYKGDFARVFLYMSVRYASEFASWESQNCIGQWAINANGYQSCLLNRLLYWHQIDPPSSLEMSRNDAIELRQGNRNPFVDKPSWASLIWGVSDGDQLTAEACESCPSLDWQIVEVSSNSSLNNNGQWTASGTGFTCNAYCGQGCAEYAESWLISGPIDITNTTQANLRFTAEEDFGDTPLEFLWTSTFSGCISDASNNWQSLGSLVQSQLPGENIGYDITLDISGTSGESGVYLAIRYADDGIDGYNYWRLDNFEIEAGACPPIGTPIAHSCPSCPADIVPDGIINVDDFLALNSLFDATCNGCPEDITRDDIVDVNDFLALNSAFGMLCP